MERFSCIHEPVGLKLYWEPPPPNYLKVNCDASIFRNNGQAGFGCVLRSANGCWIIGQFGHLPLWSIFRSELCAVWQGLMLAWKTGVKHIVCETDSLEVFTALHNIHTLEVAVENDLLQKIENMLLWSWSVQFRLIKTETNEAADWLEKLLFLGEFF
ncbi:hypothetical protein PIB30_117763 [Stylosanthes scabra]|uniref:RNase H type-1 domain-containing protein n=1 Tax=Stylosanthes scabra TaxID=79078 RepID=A0ABU6XE84_9FABA|nr:hypothetical protein [Stylosanthes scabra]